LARSRSERQEADEYKSQFHEKIPVF
jgi:hypothetical protein